MRTVLPLLIAAFVAVEVVARPWPDDGRVIDDSYERYEVFVPDGSGQLTQQMMTLKEIRALLARQSLEAEQDYLDKTEVLSLEGGKGAVVSPPVESPTHQAEVTDVVSSVKTIMAAEMAKLSPENEDVFVVLATGDQPAASSINLNTSETVKTSLVDEVPVKSVPEPVPVAPVVVPAVAEKVEVLPEAPGSDSGAPEKTESVPEMAETVPGGAEIVLEEDQNVPEVAQSVPEAAETMPEVVEVIPEVSGIAPEVAQPVPEASQSVPEVAETVPGSAETVPEVAQTVPEALGFLPVETTAAEGVPVPPTREKSQAEPFLEHTISVQVPAAVPVETADVPKAVQIIPVTEQDPALTDSMVMFAAEETSSDEADEPTVDKTLGIPDSASIVGQIPYFNSTILSTSTPSLEDLTDFTDADAFSSADSAAQSTEEAGSEQLSDDTVAEETDEETMDSTEAMETSEIPDPTESLTEAEVVTEDPEEYGIAIENNVRDRPVFYQNVLPSDDDHHHGNGHHVEHSGHDEQHHHDHHDDHHDHHDHGDDHHGHHDNGHHGHHDDHHGHHGSSTSQVTFDPVPDGNKGLLATNAAQVQELDDLSVASNNMAWKVWNNAIKERSVESNQVFSPLALTSAIGVAFLGARGSSADTIDSVLGLDALTSRNPHLHLRQVAHDLESSEYFSSLMDHTIFVDKNKGPVLDIFKARVDTLYGAKIASTHEELARTVQNLAQKSSTKMSAFLNEDAMKLRSPLGILSTASLKANWPVGQVIDDELQFLNLPSSAQVTARRLVPVAAVQANGVFYAGYNADLDATAAALPLYPARSSVEELYLGKNADMRTSAALNEAGHLSLILLMPGSPSKFQAGGAGLASLEARLAQDPQVWNQLMRSMVPKSLQVQFPQLKSQSSLRLGRALMAVQTPARVGYGSGPAVLAKLFDPDSADFSGVTGSRNLYVVDVNQFVELNVSSVASAEGLDRSTIGSRSDVTCELKRKSSASKSAAAAAAAKVTKSKSSVSTTTKRPAPTSTSTKRKTSTAQKTSNKSKPSAASAASAAPAKTAQKTDAANKTSAPKTNRPKVDATASSKVANSTNSTPAQATSVKQPSKTTSKSTSKTASSSTTKTSSKSTTKTASKSAAKNASKSTSKTASKSTTKTASKSAAKTALKSTNKTTNKTSSKQSSQSTFKASSKLTNETTTKQSSKTVSKQPSQPTSKSTSKATQKSVTKTNGQVTNDSSKPHSNTTSKSTTKTSTKQSLKTVPKSTSKGTSRPSNKTSSKQTTKTASKVTNKQTTKPKPLAQTSTNATAPTKQTSKPTTKSTSQTASKRKQQTSNKSTSSSTTKTTSKLTSKSTSKSTSKPTSKPTTKPTSKPTTKPTPKPTTKPTPKSTSRSTSKTTTKPTTKPTKSSSSKRPSGLRPIVSKSNGNSGSKSNVSKKAQVNSSSTKAGRADDAQQRLVFNRAFLYAVRHNPTGMLLYIGRYVQP